MIAWLAGSVIHRDMHRGTVTIAARGVGYEVHVVSAALEELTPGGAEAQDAALWIHSVTREDGTSLFGFRQVEERELFRLLLSVPGVGPKSALAVLGAGSLGTLVTVVEQGDTKTLQRSPGIGKKTAEQIVLSLKEKIGAFAHLRSEGASGRNATTVDGNASLAGQAASGHEALVEEATLSLVGWGFRAKLAKNAAELAIGELVAQGSGSAAPTLEDVLRLSMRTLAQSG